MSKWWLARPSSRWYYKRVTALASFRLNRVIYARLESRRSSLGLGSTRRIFYYDKLYWKCLKCRYQIDQLYNEFSYSFVTIFVLKNVTVPFFLFQGCSENRGSPGKIGGLRGSGCDSGNSATSQSSSRGHHGNDNSRDGDLLAHAASALRRLNFKSAGGSRSCKAVPKVVVMGSSTNSETTINTSTDSANTTVTMVKQQWPILS